MCSLMTWTVETEMKRECFLNRLYVFINVGAEEHAQDGQEVHFEEKAQRKFYQDQIHRHRWIQAQVQRLPENILHSSLGCDDLKNFPQNAA